MFPITNGVPDKIGIENNRDMGIVKLPDKISGNQYISLAKRYELNFIIKEQRQGCRTLISPSLPP